MNLESSPIELAKKRRGTIPRVAGFRVFTAVLMLCFIDSQIVTGVSKESVATIFRFLGL